MPPRRRRSKTGQPGTPPSELPRPLSPSADTARLERVMAQIRIRAVYADILHFRVRALAVYGQPSIMEFETCSSVTASTRRRTPVVISSSTWTFTCATPASANTTGVVSERVAARLALSSTATLFTGTNVSAKRHANTRREKWSIRACREARVPSSRRMRVVSICHISFGPSGSKPDRGFRGVTSESGPSPAESPHEAVPGRGRSPHPAEPLGQDRERPGGNVTVLGRGHHVLDHPDLRWRQSMRRRAPTRRLIVECTHGVPPLPCSIPRAI